MAYFAALAEGANMSVSPWDNPDLDDYEQRQAELEGAGEWADSEFLWSESLHAIDSQDDASADDLTRNDRRPRSGATQPPELSAPVAVEKRFRLMEDVGERTYVRDETGWQLDGRAVTLYPLVGRLESQLRNRLAAEDRLEPDLSELVRRAWLAQALKHPDRVEALSRRALRALRTAPGRMNRSQVSPEWLTTALAAAAMLSSALRQQREAAQALEETEEFADYEYAPLMTSRAAALCDVGRWAEARALAVRARDIHASAEVLKLLQRIDRHVDAEYAEPPAQ